MTIIGLLSNKTRGIKALLFHVQLNIVSRGGMISIQCPMFSEWAMWGCLTALFVYVLMIWIRDVKNGSRLRQRTAIFAINRFQKKNIRFHIPNLNAVSDVQWVRMCDSSLPIRKLLFRGRRVLAETKTKVWTFAIFVPQGQEQPPTSNKCVHK